MTLPPDRRRLDADLQDGPFLAGVADGRWGLVEEAGATVPAWPLTLFWLAAASRNGSAERFFVRIDCGGYPSQSPTATFWDTVVGKQLAPAQWPKGKDRVAAVFRTDWENGRAFYHPFDRVANGGHGDWAKKYPAHVWDGGKHTIVDFLSVFYVLLNCNEYSGI